MINIRHASLKALTFAVPWLLATVVQADDWPQWRGPNRDGAWHETGVLESFPAQGLKVRWRVPIGWGYSSPVIANGRVYLTDCDGKLPRAKERVFCFEEATGKRVWDHSTPVTYAKDTYFTDKDGRPTTPGQLPTPTLVVNAERLYALGMSGDVICLDARKGEVIWTKHLAREYQLGEFPCPKASPLIEGDLLILAIGGKPNACVVALDRHSGKEAWRALDDSVTHSSPIAITAGGKRQLIVWTNEAVSSLDPVTGRVYWRERLLTTSDFVVSTPVCQGNLLLIGGLMFKLDAEKPAASVLWPKTKAVSRRILSNTSTALVQDGCVFSAKSSGQLVCLEASSGRQLWETSKVTDAKGGASIHLCRNGSSVFLYTERGELILAKLSSQGYEEISRARLLDPTYPFGGRNVAWAPPAYADRCIFARNDKELVCVSLAAEQSGLAASTPRDKTATPAQQYQAILKEYEGGRGFRNAATDEERKAAVEAMAKFPRRFTKLAEKDPRDPIALEALIQAVRVLNAVDSLTQTAWETNATAFPAGRKDDSLGQMVALLLRDHIGSAKLGLVCERMRYGVRKEYEVFLRKVVQASPHKEVQGLACLSLADFLNYHLRKLDLIKERPEFARRSQELLGKAYFDELQRRGHIGLSQEVEALLVRAGTEFGDVKMPYGGTVGEEAKASLFEIRHLAVGKEASDIEGKDQDGKPFKLSDYRGKVVLLYFWSEY
jgi:outer membrane protein assembly factor BamB